MGVERSRTEGEVFDDVLPGNNRARAQSQPNVVQGMSLQKIVYHIDCTHFDDPSKTNAAVANQEI